MWDCTLCQFPIKQDVPTTHRQTWAAAVAHVLKVINTAESGLELERGLKWLLILPKALLRTAKRGGKAGKGLLAKRFNCLVRGDWGSLLVLLESDCKDESLEFKKRKNMQHGQPTEAAELERKRKNAMLLSKGLISKAVRCINSYGIGNLDDPNVLSQMKAKYPSRSDQLPLSATKGQCIDNLVGLSEALLDLSPGVSPGATLVVQSLVIFNNCCFIQDS